MPNANLEFHDLAEWAAWTSAASSVNPYNRLNQIDGPILLGTKGGLAAEGFARTVFTQAISKCKEGELDCAMPAVEVLDVQTELEEILSLYGLIVFFPEEATIISWNHFDEQLPKSAYELKEKKFGVWAYWMTKAFWAMPEEKLTRTDERTERRLRSVRWECMLQIRHAATEGLPEVTICTGLHMEELITIIRNDLCLNGFRKVVEIDDAGTKTFQIQIREPVA